jgi:hypothetical protein
LETHLRDIALAKKELRPCCAARMPLTEENVNYLPMLTSLAGRINAAR